MVAVADLAEVAAELALQVPRGSFSLRAALFCPLQVQLSLESNGQPQEHTRLDPNASADLYTARSEAQPWDDSPIAKTLRASEPPVAFSACRGLRARSRRGTLALLHGQDHHHLENETRKSFSKFCGLLSFRVFLPIIWRSCARRLLPRRTWSLQSSRVRCVMSAYIMSCISGSGSL